MEFGRHAFSSEFLTGRHALIKILEFYFTFDLYWSLSFGAYGFLLAWSPPLWFGPYRAKLHDDDAHSTMYFNYALIDIIQNTTHF